MSRCPTYPGTRLRKGAIYVMVLAISLLVSVIGVAALTAVRIQIRTADNTNDAEEARVYARSGAEWIRCVLNTDATWRTTRTSGSTTSLAIGAGTFSVMLVDPVDGNFANSPLDPVQVTVTGFKGRARQSVRFTLTAVPVAYSSLNTAMCAAGSIAFKSGVIGGAGAIVSNSNVTVSGSSTWVSNDVEAAGTISGTNYLGSKTSGAAARKLPDATVFDYYIANGTAISYSSVGSNFEKLLLSPNSNPFGATNPQGIYVIDCGGNSITIKNLRVVGTLVILNCKSDSKFDKQVNLAPAVANFPALLVNGSMGLEFDGAPLTESNVGKNLNPPGTPYNGASNTTSSDSYPSILNGLVYISGNVTMKNSNALGGPLIVGGTISADDDLTLKSDSVYTSSPPPGFFDTPPLKPAAGSWAQSVN